MATREKNGSDQPIRSSGHASSWNKLSLLHGAPPILCLGRGLGRRKGREGQMEGSVKRKKASEETEAQGEEGLQELGIPPKLLKGKDHDQSTVPSRCPAQT